MPGVHIRQAPRPQDKGARRCGHHPACVPTARAPSSSSAAPPPGGRRRDRARTPRIRLRPRRVRPSPRRDPAPWWHPARRHPVPRLRPFRLQRDPRVDYRSLSVLLLSGCVALPPLSWATPAPLRYASAEAEPWTQSGMAEVSCAPPVVGAQVGACQGAHLQHFAVDGPRGTRHGGCGGGREDGDDVGHLPGASGRRAGCRGGWSRPDRCPPGRGALQESGRLDQLSRSDEPQCFGHASSAFVRPWECPFRGIVEPRHLAAECAVYCRSFAGRARP